MGNICVYNKKNKIDVIKDDIVKVKFDIAMEFFYVVFERKNVMQIIYLLNFIDTYSKQINNINSSVLLRNSHKDLYNLIKIYDEVNEYEIEKCINYSTFISKFSTNKAFFDKLYIECLCIVRRII